MKKITLAICLALFVGCSEKEKTDRELLDLDLQSLKEQVQNDKVTTYKFCKIMMRASADPDTTSAQHKVFNRELTERFARLTKLSRKKQLPVSAYLAIYKDYEGMKKYVVSTDEDIFPTLRESAAYNNGKKPVFLKGKAKVKAETQEHAVLSALVLFSRDLGREVSLYECSQTNPQLLEDSELKSLLLFYRGFLFFEKGLYYLSEKEASQNISWLSKDRKTDFQMTRLFFGWSGAKMDNAKTRMALLSMNYLFRGFDRMMMERKIDEKRSLDDFQKFVKLSGKLGVSNEITLSIEAYVYIKKGNNARAIATLTKLKNSPNLSAEQKKLIGESIDHLKEDDSDLLDGLFDKLFIAKIGGDYVFSQVSAIDWGKFMKKKNVPFANSLLGTLEMFKTVSMKMEQLSNGEMLEDAGNTVKETGEDLWEETKGLMD